MEIHLSLAFPIIIIVVNSNINNGNIGGSEAIGSLEKMFCYDASSMFPQFINTSSSTS